MAISSKKYDETEPAIYDTAIKKQWERVRRHSKDAGQWLELGLLHEAKLEITNSLARHNFGIRNFLPMYFLLILFVIVFGVYMFSTPIPFMSLTYFTFVSVSMIFVSILTGWIWSLRYPSSGWKHFKKAIFLDPCCADAYMHLGLIALRRYQKRVACRYFEHAIRLNVDNKKIERKLKTIYGTEFVSFFNKKTEQEIKLQEIIDHQLYEIKDHRSKVTSLENLIVSLTGRAVQAKWEMNHKTKQLTKEMNERLEAVQNDHVKQIADIKRSFKILHDTEDHIQKDFVRLTTEVMEAKAELETSSFLKAKSGMETIMGSDDWQSLLPQTRTYLATAEHTFRLLAEEEDTPDYSLIGMELCKALEAEINRTLITPFSNYLNGNKSEFLKVNQVGANKGKHRYFTCLAQLVDRVHYPEISTLTLGQYHFVLQRTLKGEYPCNEYRNFLNLICSSSKVQIGKLFLKRLETVTNRYRNAIAHESPTNKKQCIHLRRLIFTENEALLKTCCRFVNNKN